jgi:hypothetical protein
MTDWNRRRFISHVGVAAGSGLVAWNVFGSRGVAAPYSPLRASSFVVTCKHIKQGGSHAHDD